MPKVPAWPLANGYAFFHILPDENKRALLGTDAVNIPRKVSSSLTG
jgi:hypothetical protein